MQTRNNRSKTGLPVTETCVRPLNRKDFTSLHPLVLSAIALAVGLVLATGAAVAEGPTQTAAPTGSVLENTERNVRDSGGATLTAEDQNATRADRKITAAIRKSVVKDKSLSLNAHNAKIITVNGVVTLRGPVESSAEKTKLQSIAQKTRGVKQVDNQLEPKTP